MNTSAEGRVSLSRRTGEGLRVRAHRVNSTARFDCSALLPSPRPSPIRWEREKHLAALVSGVAPVRFLGHKNETFIHWSLRLAFSTVALQRKRSAAVSPRPAAAMFLTRTHQASPTPEQSIEEVRNCSPSASLEFLRVPRSSCCCDWLSAQSRSGANGARLWQSPAAAT
jgi:hypothetical protein